MNRTWYSFYPENVPEKIELPTISLYELLARTAEKYPFHKAVIDGNEELTYTELKNASDYFAAALYNRGFRKGDRMAIMLPNSAEYIIAYFAVHRLGGIVCQVNPMYQSQELEYILQNSESKWFISFEEQQYKLTEFGSTDKLTIITADRGQVHINNLHEWIKEENNFLPQLDINPEEDTALLQYTGGTTGRSKGVMLTHANLLTNVFQSVTFQKNELQIPGERSFGLSPLFHIAGIVNLNQSILIASTYIAVRRFQLEATLELIRKHRPTIFSGNPTIYIALLNYPDLRDSDLESFKICASGTAPMPVEVMDAIKQKTKARVYEAFGMSETLITHRTPPGAISKIGSVGVPLPNTDSKIMDIETGTKEMPNGETGELIIKGPQVMNGYWRNLEETEHALRNGWMYTGDIAYMDDDGFFYVVGRKKDMIIASGYNIYPNEIEEVIYQHPAVLEACVFGVPDSYRGETVKAVIVIRKTETVTEEEILNWCNERMARYKVPRLIEFRSELPKSSVGKVLRRILVDEEKNKIKN
ncbi:long-chain fatty acid--CoA ligase [Psychrobacillus sp. NPDC096426]|uniref:long-chain-fatty-acid--CoA ligase n=1 Tax=Psychrobacillus sp. NPDC096426 TaxID=3364491 RepID=UPI00382B038E